MVKDGILGKSWLRANALLDDKKEYDEEKKKVGRYRQKQRLVRDSFIKECGLGCCVCDENSMRIHENGRSSKENNSDLN